MNIVEVVERMKRSSDFMLREPEGKPKVFEQHRLPDDVAEFYTLCGGAECFVDSLAWPIRILSPKEVTHANLFMVGEEYEDDISTNWYLIADAADGNYITIDCGHKHNGWCIESFWETYAHRGDSPIIALSFTEFLVNLLEYQGDYYYWLENRFFAGYGDAYQ